jgi:hypothetical protein
MLEGDGGAKEALEGFQQVLTMEGGTKGEWGFKALKQIVKLHFKAGDADKMMDAYRCGCVGVCVWLCMGCVWCVSWCAVFERVLVTQHTL